MKYLLSLVGLSMICCAIFLCGGNKEENSLAEDYMRIHITANSNSVFDQNLKYEVKDSVVEFLIPKLAYANDKNEAISVIFENISFIEEVVSAVLRNAKVNYSANVSITQEDMPSRAYDNLVLDAGVYDCLKIDLGDAKGDNWWCVVFPAVCFISSKNYENYEYISKIWEIINSVTQKNA